MGIPKAPTSITDAINTRCSVRDYLLDKLDRSAVGSLLAAAVRAPTAVHQEPWAFLIVQDKNTLKRLSDRAKPLFAEEAHRAHLDRGGHALDHFRKPDFNIFYNAGTRSSSLAPIRSGHSPRPIAGLQLKT